MSNFFAGKVISCTKWESTNSGAILVRVSAVNGTAVKAMLVDLKESLENIEIYELDGLSKTAMITFTADGIAEHQPGDRFLEARDNNPRTPIHRPLGYQKGSVTVLRGAKAMTFEVEQDPQQQVYNKTLTQATAEAAEIAQKQGLLAAVKSLFKA